MKTKQKSTFCQKLFSGSGWALFTMFVWELVEEAFENLIAYVLSSAVAVFVTKVLSTLAIITATQGIKVTIKRFLMPIIKEFTYSKGDDKVSKIKTFFTWLWCNKKTLTATASGAVMTLSGTGVIDVSTLPALMISGFNITPFIYYGCLAVLAVIGIFDKGLESISEFFTRIGLIKEQKEQAKIEKEAEAEIKAEEKLANQTQAEQEKAQAKAEEEAKAQAEKEQAEAEHKAKVAEAKAKILAERQAQTEN